MLSRFCRLALKTRKYITIPETKSYVKFEACTFICRKAERNYCQQFMTQDALVSVEKSNRNHECHDTESKSKALDLSTTSEPDYVDVESVPREAFDDDEDLTTQGPKRLSALDTCMEDVSDFLPTREPPRTFAYIANQSKLVQELVKLGIQLYKIEKKPKLFQEVVRLNYDVDVAPLIQLLLSIGIKQDQIGHVISRTPELLIADKEKLKIIIEFFKVQSFSREMISLMIAKCGSVLLMRPKQISRRLIYLQDKYLLTATETIHLAANAPRLLTASFLDLEERYIIMQDTMEFNKPQIKKLLLERPSLWTKSTKHMIPIYHFARDEMKLSNEEILAHNYILGYKIHKLEARYRFLQHLKKAQFDATKPNYISPTVMVSCDVTKFCTEIAKCDVHLFSDFVKTL